MKKLFFLSITLILALSFTACGTKPSNSQPINTPTPTEAAEPTKAPESGGDSDNESILDGSLENILDKIYETANVSEDFKRYIQEGLQKTEITEERSAYYLGKEGIEYEEALASEPIMMPSAYELTLVRVKEGADVEKIKKEIKDNANPQKWICIGVKPENVIVDSIDDVIVIIMSDNECKALHEAFLALKGQN